MTAPTPCPHRQTRLVAQDSDAEYRECLVCGAILEKTELVAPASDAAQRVPASGPALGDAAPQDAAAEKPGFGESLSDA